jgi:COMPASS component SWD2
LSSLYVSKLFRENTQVINSIDYSRDGEFLISSSDDESIILYNTLSGQLLTKLYSKKYGVDLIRFTKSKENVIYASKNGWDESLRYLNVSNNTYLRYFKGHRDKVVSLSVCPTSEELFMSGSLDNTVRLWDFRTSNCQGLLYKQGKVSLSFDPSGNAFAIASSSNKICLYDIRSFDKAPFAEHTIDPTSTLEWQDLCFSYNGQYMLLTTPNVLYLVDAFSGEKTREYRSTNIKCSCFSPDSLFVLVGTASGTINMFSTFSGQEIGKLDAHKVPVSVLKWCPTQFFLASGDSKLAFWIPDPDYCADETSENNRRY